LHLFGVSQEDEDKIPCFLVICPRKRDGLGRGLSYRANNTWRETFELCEPIIAVIGAYT
jgi:hypothetical protein